MITKSTVFVLGAGSSVDFGYPLGKSLVDIIIQDLGPENNKNSISLFNGFGFSEEELSLFREQLINSVFPSIDSFLEHRNEEERNLGKIAIANAIIPSRASK